MSTYTISLKTDRETQVNSIKGFISENKINKISIEKEIIQDEANIMCHDYNDCLSIIESAEISNDFEIELGKEPSSIITLW